MEKLKKTNLRLKTSSIWTYPKKRFFDLLKKVEQKGLPKSLCVIGCADGTYVLPAAKRGFLVCAIDIDKKMIYGGYKIINNKNVKVIGLVNRIKIEELQDFIEVVDVDFMSHHTNKTYSIVFTSGSIHYKNNEKHSVAKLINKIMSYVSPGGTLVLEYIHKSNTANDSNRYYFNKKEIEYFFENPEWRITSHKVKKYIENPNPQNNSIHEIWWGRIYVSKH